MKHLQSSAGIASEPTHQPGPLTCFQWDVDNYQTRHSFVWEYGASLIDLFEPKPDTDGPLRILDIGCGSGELAARLRELFPTAIVSGLDADPSMVGKAQEQFPSIDFAVADVRNFCVDEPVDVIFSNAALHWVPRADAPRAVAAMGRALKPGGQFVVEFGGRGNVDGIVRAVQRALNLPESSNPWFFPSVSEYTTMLEEIGGIQVTLAMLYDRPTPLQDEEHGMRNWLRMFGNKFFEGMSESGRDHAIQAACEIARPAMYDEATGQWTADYSRIRIVGRKKA